MNSSSAESRVPSILFCAIVMGFLVLFGFGAACMKRHIQADSDRIAYDVSVIESDEVDIASIATDAKGKFPPTSDGFNQLVKALVKDKAGAFSATGALQIIRANQVRDRESQLVPVPPSGPQDFWTVSSPAINKAASDKVAAENQARLQLSLIPSSPPAASHGGTVSDMAPAGR
jgi:hypothetical protein